MDFPLQEGGNGMYAHVCPYCFRKLNCRILCQVDWRLPPLSQEGALVATAEDGDLAPALEVWHEKIQMCFIYLKVLLVRQNRGSPSAPSSWPSRV